MKAKILYFAVFLLSFNIVVPAQSTFLPKNLGAGINSPYDEVSPVISGDQKTLFFTRKNHPQNGFGVKNSADIWVSQLQKDGSWSEAQRSASLNIGQRNYALSLSADGKSLLIYNDEGLSLSTWQNDAWSAPQKINIKASKEATWSADGQRILFSKGGKLYISEKNAEGTWQKGEQIKGITHKVATPFLLEDGKTLYFSSTVKGRLTDLYKIERLGTDWVAWSTPVALNDTINTVGQETHLRTNPNGAWGYFSSTHQSPTGKADIFMVKLYEDRPYVLVTGKVMNATTKRLLINKDITLLLNGEPVEASAVNRDSASFKIKLPFRKQYTLAAKVHQYGAKNYTIDATSDREFKQIRLDLEEEPAPFALLKGKLMVKNTDRTIPAAADPKIVVDGEEVDSATVDAAQGTYSIRLNHGSIYYVQVSAKRFESLPDIVDLKGIDGYEEIVFDLQADAEKMAIVTGKIIDKKTNQPLETGVPASVKVEGVSSVTAGVDSVTRQYELRFPLRERYILSAVVPEHYPLYETIDVTQETNEVNISRDLVVVPAERGQSIGLNNIFFEPGKTVALSPSSFPELDRLVAYLTENPKVKIEIGAHSDPSTKVSTLNQAKAVVTYITSKGVAKNRVLPHGFGSAKPVASNKTPEGKAANRRIEFTILEK